MKAYSLNLIVLASILFIANNTIAQQNNYDSWTDVIEYQIFSADHIQENYRRPSPPYKRHVRASFVFRNITSNKRIIAIEFQARFLNAFNEIIYKTGDLISNTDLSPGDFSSLFDFIHFEDKRSDIDTPYSKLKGLAENKTLRAEINVKRIAFNDGDILQFESEEWHNKFSKDNVESEFKPPFITYKEMTGYFKSKPFEISTEKWKITSLVFDGAKSTIEIKVYDSSTDSLIKEQRFKLDPLVQIDQFEINQSGSFYIVVNSKKGEWTIHIHEQK